MHTTRQHKVLQDSPLTKHCGLEGYPQRPETAALGLRCFQEAAGGATPSPSLRGRVLGFAAGESPGDSGCSPLVPACAQGQECAGDEEQKPAESAAEQERIAAIEAQIQRLTEVPPCLLNGCKLVTGLAEPLVNAGYA